MKTRLDPSDRSGTPVPGSGTTKYKTYRCETCRDSGVFWLRKATLPGAAGLDVHDDFVTCPACDGKSRLCGEVDDTVPTPFLHLQRNIRHGWPS